MTAQEAAQRLGVSRSTLQRLIKDQTLTPINATHNPLLKRPRRLLFSRAEVERLAQGTTTNYAVTVHTPPTVAAVERLLR